jgi:broad specificity phosphatase PhoE
MTELDRKKRRRRRRAAAILAFLVLAVALTWFLESQATTTIIVVRYADVADGTNPAGSLTAAGRRRAQELARVLADIDVGGGLDAIFANQNLSSQQTVQPLAERLDIPVQVVDSKNVGGLRDMLRTEYKGKIVLVVTDRDVLPRLIRRLRGSEDVPAIADAEYDNIYVVTIPWYGKVKTIRLQYGEPYASKSELR